MKVTKNHIRFLSYAGAGVVSYGLVMVIISSMFGITQYDLQVDDRIVPNLNAQLFAYIQDLPCGIRVAPDISAQEIQKQFPWIQSVSFFRIPTKTMRVAVTIGEPQVRVNAAIVTDHLHVLPACTFVPTALTQIPALHVNFHNVNRAEVPQAFIPHAKTFTDERFKPYIISWIDEYRARLTDKEQPQFNILFNTHSIPDAATFAHCAVIKKQLEERGSFSGRQKEARWVADVRFDRQVIVFSEKGGIAHG
jgi:hypothetical protein